MPPARSSVSEGSPITTQHAALYRAPERGQACPRVASRRRCQYASCAGLDVQTMTASYPTVPTICEIAAISASVVDAIAAGRTGLGCSWQLRVRRLHWLRGLSSGHGSLAGSAGATRCCSRGAAKKTAAQSKAAQVQTDRLVAGLQLPRLNGQGLQRRRGGVLPRRVNGEMPRRGLLKIRGQPSQSPRLETVPLHLPPSCAAFMCRLLAPFHPPLLMQR